MEFRIHEDAREEWERLRTRLGVAGARRWYAGLCAWLEAHDGVPPDAAPSDDAPPVYWLLFGDASVQYVLAGARRRWWDVFRIFGRPGRTVFVGFGEPWPPTPV